MLSIQGEDDASVVNTFWENMIALIKSKKVSKLNRLLKLKMAQTHFQMYCKNKFNVQRMHLIIKYLYE